MKVRLWKLGSLEHGIIPSAAAIKKLERLVKKLTKEEEGVINIVWGPELEIIETNDSVEYKIVDDNLSLKLIKD